MNLSKGMWVRILAVLVLVLTTAGMASAAGMPGAIFTTNAGCTGVNINLFDNKGDVYLDGGPAGGGPGLPDGTYWVKVTEPDGTLLGISAGADITVAGGEFVMCYKLFALTNFADTTNPGGEYKVWVGTDSTFDTSKTDNFKVQAGVQPAYLSVTKFYDANANGLNDDGLLLTGWKMHIWDSIDWDRYTPVSMLLAPDTYYVDEYMPIEPNWMRTAPAAVPVEVMLGPGDSKSVEFGNLCLGAGGGKTLGFWSNKNGAAMIGADDLLMLRNLNLRNADGSNFDPTNFNAFRAWLLGANAVNMANMLSAQLAAMELNVFNGLVNGGALIYAPGTMSANALGFATVAAVMAEANAELGLHGYTPSGDANRAYQEALKNALDKANNNLNFVQAQPCPFNF